MKISLCMIVKNEEKVLDNCLSSVHDLVDEIIIVDTGSIDTTKEIAAKYTDKIYDFEWVDDFSLARNFSFSKATMDYVMWLDADDVILEEDRKAFKKFKESIDGSVCAYSMKYVCQRNADGLPLVVIDRNRVVKRSMNYKWIGPIHEYLDIKEKPVYVSVSITHNKKEVSDKKRNLRIFEKMIADGYVFNLRDYYLYGNCLYALKMYDKAAAAYEEGIFKYIDEYGSNKWYLYNSLMKLAKCYSELNDYDKQLDTLFLILKHQVPTAACLNEIGNYYFNSKKYKEAIFYYSISVSSAINETSDFDKFSAYLKLGCCYYSLKNYKKAYVFNEKAGEISPNNASYLKNKDIFCAKMDGLN